MPAEYILVLMAVSVIAFTYMDIWGDPREDPRLSGAPAPRPAGPAPLRFAFDEGTGARALSHALPRRRLPQGPRLSLAPLPVPDIATFDASGWGRRYLAMPPAGDGAGPLPLARIIATGDAGASRLARLVAAPTRQDYRFTASDGRFTDI